MDWRLVFTTFGMLFLAELGDKTQLLVFSLSARHRAPWPVFLGASLALSVVSLLGAFVGGIVGGHLPTKYAQLGAGTLFIVVGAFIVYRSLAQGQ